MSKTAKTTTEKLEAINENTLICGIDIAKKVHWARFVNWRGIPIGKAVRFENNKTGFDLILAEASRCSNENGMEKIIFGMEPTGPYWKALARWLKAAGKIVVGVNTHHTKQAKCLDDNSPTKNDKKDALVIARLVKDGRYFEPYLPECTYAELRVTSNNRIVLLKQGNTVKNRIMGLLDEYFPEFQTVFKQPLKGKASIQILGNCPFPQDIVALGVDGVLAEVRKAVKRTVGKQKVAELMAAARESVGVTHGLESARLQLRQLLEALLLLNKQLEEVEARMAELLGQSGYKQLLLSVKGIGVVSAASFLGEIGDPMRFENPRQIHRLAGYNLVENSSGQNKSGTSISKRGRRQLRALLYRMAMILIVQNKEMKRLYRYLRDRTQNPLKGKQALVVISKKIVTILYYMVKTQSEYSAELVFGATRMQQFAIAA